ncbi:hypothetical protein AB0D08_40825, partial [Kitasatospora sp. NPDC048540]|uniref:hypothetical protein n=1 Tax=Kitasatospora sp. NPDC048540 TaxID=3155634 RepID=UPI0033D5290C
MLTKIARPARGADIGDRGRRENGAPARGAYGACSREGVAGLREGVLAELAAVIGEACLTVPTTP